MDEEKQTINLDNSVLLPCAVPQSREVYEMYGEEGSGKTQCLLHLLAGYLLPKEWKGISLGGRNTGVLYIDNDYHFNMLRLTVIMEHRITQAFSKDNSVESLTDEELDTFIKLCLKNLFIMRCSNTAQMVITLHSLEQVLKSKSNVSVLMIDSIAAFYWIDRSNGAESIRDQETMLIKACTAIEELKDKFDLVIFATKPAIFSRKAKDENNEQTNRMLDHCEYLCKSWQKMVNHRFIFSKASENAFNIKSDSSKSGLHVDSNFVISETGLVFVK